MSPSSQNFTKDRFHLLKSCAILGFGSQGKAQALNLRDSGVEVIIGLPPESKSRQVALDLGFEVVTNEEATKRASIIALALPDLKMKEVFVQEILPFLREGQTLLFLHGFALHYQLVVPPKEVNTILVAPNGPGEALRNRYLSQQGLPAKVGVHHDATGEARAIAWEWASALGCDQMSVFETTFAEETECDLFGEQAVLCGGVSELIIAAFETLVEAGCRPEIAFLEVCYELQLTVDLISQYGIAGMMEKISQTASYGAATVGPKVIDAHVRKNLKEVFSRIRSGEFAQEWIEEYETQGEKYQFYQKFVKKGKESLIEKIGSFLRAKK